MSSPCSVATMTDHDPLCPSYWCNCNLIANVRADERENEKKRYLTAQAETGQMVSTLSYDLSEARLFIKNLRARVEALPPVPPNGSVLGHRFSDDRLIWRSEVIALLEEEDRD